MNEFPGSDCSDFSVGHTNVKVLVYDFHCPFYGYGCDLKK